MDAPSFFKLRKPKQARVSCAQVNWGPFSGKYLTSAVGAARSYVQVQSAVIEGSGCVKDHPVFKLWSGLMPITAMHAVKVLTERPLVPPLLLMTRLQVKLLRLVNCCFQDKLLE